jgi:chaperone modulatory protein CbpM
MTKGEKRVLTGVVLDERISFTLSELSSTCQVPAEIVVDMVQEGLLEPEGSSPGEWRFTGHALWRARTALRLQRDLGANLAGVALALDLLDELQELRRRVRALEHQLFEE